MTRWTVSERILCRTFRRLWTICLTLGSRKPTSSNPWRCRIISNLNRRNCPTSISNRLGSSMLLRSHHLIKAILLKWHLSNWREHMTIWIKCRKNKLGYLCLHLSMTARTAFWHISMFLMRSSLSRDKKLRSFDRKRSSNLHCKLKSFVLWKNGRRVSNFSRNK